MANTGSHYPNIKKILKLTQNKLEKRGTGKSGLFDYFRKKFVSRKVRASYDGGEAAERLFGYGPDKIAFYIGRVKASDPVGLKKVLMAGGREMRRQFVPLESPDFKFDFENEFMAVMRGISKGDELSLAKAKGMLSAYFVKKGWGKFEKLEKMPVPEKRVKPEKRQAQQGARAGNVPSKIPKPPAPPPVPKSPLINIGPKLRGEFGKSFPQGEVLLEALHARGAVDTPLARYLMESHGAFNVLRSLYGGLYKTARPREIRRLARCLQYIEGKPVEVARKYYPDVYKKLEEKNLAYVGIDGKVCFVEYLLQGRAKK